MTDTPHENDPELELDRLASGHVDGDLSADDRRRVGDDPGVLARVELFADHRQQLLELGDLLGAATHRDTAIAAALAEFDRLRPPAPNNVLRWRPRTTQRILTLAAAVVALAVVGVTVLGSRSDDSPTTAMDVPAENAAQAGQATVGSPETVPAAEADIATTITIGAIDAPATAAVTINDGEQLLELAAQYGIDMGYTATTAAADVLTRTLTTSPCIADGETFLSDVIYQGSLGIALVGTDGHARILDTNCAVLLDVAP